MRKYHYYNDEKFPIFVTTETTVITKFTFQESGTLWENDSMKQFFDKIDKNKNSTIVDIGAQSGLYSLYAKYLPNSTFYSFEPYSTTYNLLNDNIKLNMLSNVKTFNMAISDSVGIAKLNTCMSHNGLHTLGNNVGRFSDIKSIDVQTTTLDEFFYKKNIAVDFIKIDTEGYEYFILKGGRETIKKYKPIIQMEWNKINMTQCNVTEKMLFELINEMEYDILSMIEEEILIGPKLSIQQ